MSPVAAIEIAAAVGDQAGCGGIVIQASNLEAWIMRYELSDDEWGSIRPMLPNKARDVPRVDDRRVLNGIFRVLRSGAPWRDLLSSFGAYTTCTTGSFHAYPVS